MKDLVIYLAYSPEDAPYDREALGNYIRALNDIFREQGGKKYLRLVECEDAPPEPASTNMVVSLSVKHGGGREILEQLWEQPEKPQILTFFCTNGPHASSYYDMLDWVDKTMHYRTEYQHISQVREQLFLHLLRYPSLPFTLEKGIVMAGNERLIDLEQTGIVNRTPQFRALCQKAENANALRLRLQAADPDFENNPDYLAANSAYQKALEEKERFLKDYYDFWHGASCTPSLRQQLADEACRRGDLEGALRVLNIPQIELERQQKKEQRAREARLEAQQYVDDLLRRAHTLLLMGEDPNRLTEVETAYETACGWEREDDLPRKALLDYALFLQGHGAPERTLKLIPELLEHAAPVMRGTIWHMGAACYSNLGQPQQAIDSYAQAIAEFRALPDEDEDTTVLLVKTLASMSEHLSRQGLPDRAKEKLEEAVELCKSLSRDCPHRIRLEIAIRSALAELNTRCHRYDEAADQYRLALQIPGDTAPDPAAAGELCLKYAGACLNQRPVNREMVRKCLRQAERALAQVGDQANTSAVKMQHDIYLLRHHLAIHEQDWKRAESSLLDAIGLIKSRKILRQNYICDYIELAKFYLKPNVKDVDAAQKYARTAAAEAESTLLDGKNADLDTAHICHLITGLSSHLLAHVPHDAREYWQEEFLRWAMRTFGQFRSRIETFPDADLGEYVEFMWKAAWYVVQQQRKEQAREIYDDLLAVTGASRVLLHADGTLKGTICYAGGILCRLLERHAEASAYLSNWIRLRLQYAPELDKSLMQMAAEHAMDAADSAMKVKKPADAVRVLGDCKELLCCNRAIPGYRENMLKVCTALAKAYEKDNKPGLAKKERQYAAQFKP